MGSNRRACRGSREQEGEKEEQEQQQADARQQGADDREQREQEREQARAGEQGEQEVPAQPSPREMGEQEVTEVGEQEAEEILDALARREKPLQMQIFMLKDYDPDKKAAPGRLEKDW